MIKIISILKKFDLKALKIIPWKLGYLCYTDKGIFYLKKSKYSGKQLEFAQLAKKHIIDRGFTKVDLFKEVEGRPYIKSNNDLYVITKWILGRKMGKNIRDLMRSMEFMALFHKAAKGFIYDNSEHCYDLQNVLLKKWEDLIYIRNLIGMKKIKDNIDKIYLDNIDLIKDLSITAIKNLQDSGYFKMAERERKEGYFAHCNYTFKNLIYNDAKLYLIGFETARLELRVFDIANYIYNVMRRFYWDIDLALKMLSQYNKNRTIEREEIRIISSLLLFPHDLWKLSTIYYFGEHQWNKKAACSIFIKELENLQKNLYFLEKYNRLT